MSPVDLTAKSSLGVPEIFGDCFSCAAHESFGLLINGDIFKIHQSLGTSED